MDEIIVLPLIQVLLGRLKSITDESRFLHMMLDTLVKELEYVASMIGQAQVNQTDYIGYASKVSLRNLQDLLFDIDDLVDIEIGRFMRRTLMERLVYIFPTVIFTHKLDTNIHTLREIKRDLTDVQSTSIEKKSEATIPDSLGSRSQAVSGREREKEELLHLILEGEFSVVSIVGLVGIGKTTLAQCIFEDERIIHYFEHMLWLGFGRDCDEVSIWDGHSMMHSGLATIKREVGTLFLNKRVFLVLDNCWDKAACESFLRAMPDFNSFRSVVMVTTHSRSLASALGAMPRAHVYQLEGLSPDSSYQILTEKATFQNDPGFDHTSKKIVELCRGVPSVLSIVRELIRTNGVERVLARLEDCSFDEITKSFTCYYDMLPSHLKLPFQTLFSQKACGLSVDALTCLWMALGFLYPPDTQAPTQLLDLGREYLREFAESDLPSNVVYAPGGVIRDIHMDDHIYGLSMSKARSQWVIISDLSSQKIDKTARYIIWVEDPQPSAALPPQLLNNARKARLFILHTRGQASAELVRDIVSGFKCLRVLGLGGCNVEKLPHSIGYLKHLRYLDLGRNAKLKRLPSSISNLWYLQTLLLHGCEQLEVIPASIGRLKNLMYLTLTTLQKSLPEEIGKLTSLRTLGLARCQRLASLPRSIKNLKFLETLAIVDCPEVDLEADSSVVGFKGNDGIDTLLLRGLSKFVGLPSDLGAFSVAMKHLVIQSCILLKETMWIDQLKSLRSFTIEGCPELSGIMGGTTQFDSLLELVIRSCPRLGSTTWIKQCLSLRSLILHSCTNLVGLDAGFSELKYLQRLEISGCPHLTERCAISGDDWKHIEHVKMIELDGESLKS